MSSSLYHPRPVLSSQRCSPSPEYLDMRRGGGGGGGGGSFSGGSTRPPLRESNGNAQSHGFNGLISCYPNTMASPSMQPGMQAPMVPSQSFDSLYRLQTPRQHPHQHQPHHQHPHPHPHPHPHQLQQHQSRYQTRGRSGVNPLYFWPAFRQYRNRQAHKDTQKDKGGVWRRPELEDAFVDSVLLMPHMGRRKFSMGGKLHGRNMLISEYIFVICVAVLGSKEIFRIDNSNDSIEQMGRKQVSSHMQVVKKFFEDLRCFHFLFPAEDKREPGSTNSEDYYDEEEQQQESFKSNPVLTALAEGRVPEVRPNYEYFSQLLGLQSGITVRPKTCEILVSSSDIQVGEDGTTFDGRGAALEPSSFPHLNKYAGCDDRPNVLGKDVLLHEYTRSMDRTTSGCVKAVTRRWQREAPAMHETLELPATDEECLLLEMCATLELHEHAKFPSGSELTGFVEVAVTQPALQGHRWKCVTRLTRPSELHGDGDDEDDDDKARAATAANKQASRTTSVYTNESGIHRRGCSDGRPDCDCHARGPRQEIHVPFPAVEWASILSMAVEYPDVEHQRLKERRKGGAGVRSGPVSGSSADRAESERAAGSKRKRPDDEGDASAWARRQPTGSDLICKVAMYQELWSCAPDSTRWTRQAIIFWRFNTTNQWYKYSPVFRPAGTTWRWLTVNDPMSRYHQQRALVYPSSSSTSSSAAAAGLCRDALMSPTPSVSQQLTAAMSETFSSAWDAGAAAGGQVSIHHAGVFDSFSGGLATPPPSASMQASYSSGGSFDSAMASAGGINYLPTGNPAGPGSGPGSGLAPGGPPSYYDVKPMGASGLNPYTAATSSLDLSSQLVYDGSQVDASSLQGWHMPALESWPGSGSGNTSSGPGSGVDWSHAAAKVDPADQHSSIWNPVQWGPVSAAASAGLDRVASPRDAKRRRTEPQAQQAPLTAGW